MDVSGAYGFEAVVLSMMLKADTDPSNQFFLTAENKDRIYHIMIMKLSHVIER